MISFIENTAASLQMLGKKPLDSFFKLLGGNDEYLVDMKDNLVSFVSIHGSTKLVGVEEREEILEQFDLSLSSLLQDSGHVLDIAWKRDPEASPLIVEDFVGGMQKGAEKMGMEIPELLAGKTKVLSKRISFEETVIALWTKATILNSVEKSADVRTRLREQGRAKMNAGMPPLQGLSKLVIKHNAATDALVDKLVQCGIAAEKMNTKAALRLIRENFYPSYTGGSFSPVYPGEQHSERVEERVDADDVSGKFPAPLSEQILTHGSEDINSYKVAIGDRVFGYVNMVQDTPAQTDFTQLVDIINRSGSKLPWRVLWRIEGGVTDRHIDGFLASVLEKTNSVNRIILDKIEEHAAWDRQKKTRVYLSASFATWAPISEEMSLDSQLAQLVRAIGNWQRIQVASDTRDPLEGVCASIPGIQLATVLGKAKQRLTSAFRPLPIMRPGSPWTKGSVAFHTPDGKPFYYGMGSSKQTAWFDIIVGQQGSGKSALVNALNLGAVLDFAREAKGNELPRVGIIDIGFSSRGLIECIKDGLPNDRKNEALYIRWQNKRDHAVNPFDTPLGLRFPLPVQLDAVKTFVIAALGLTDSNSPGVLKEIAEAVVEEAYLLSATETTAKTYEEELDKAVDGRLEKADITLPYRASWWEVVDALYEKGFAYEAGCAQRHAVPSLSKLAEAQNSSRITDKFENSRIQEEPALEVFNRKLDRAVSNFEILSHETRFELHTASIISLDLSEVTTGSGEAGKHKTEVMYLAARHLIGNEYYLSEDDFADIDDRYREHHISRIRSLSKRRKRLVYDEFHMTEGAEAVQLQLERDVRVGRKYDVQITLVSQLLSDFSDTLLSLARTFFICSSGGETGLKIIQEKLGLSNSAREICRTRLRGPTAEGAPVFCIFDTIDGRFEHYLMHSMSPEELWAMTTKRKDVELKRGLERKIGRTDAWRLLCKQFPGGSASSRLELIAQELSSNGAQDDPTEFLIDELIGAHKHA